jgi:membrane-bound lytic murein transglycosylase B
LGARQRLLAARTPTDETTTDIQLLKDAHDPPARPRRPAMSAPRRWARRAALSVLAGSGLTAAGFGGPFSAAALAAEAATTTTETPAQPVTATTPQADAPEPASGAQSGAAQPTTTTSTAPASTPAPSSASASPPAPSAPAATGTPEAAPQSAAPAPTVVVQRRQRTTPVHRHSKAGSSTGAGAGAQASPGVAASPTGATQNGPASVPAGTPNGVAPAPQAIGNEAGALSSLLAGSAASAQALDFYRIPLFLLPIYKAAAVQYDVPWQILAGINEVETDYGNDLSVSTAGAVGWMQFMPATWLMYGVDATDAGYADPYNPVDAIFAAARYLHAAGASHDLRRAILAYNHSQAYVEAVMLRARLVASYPRSVIATLAGLVDGRPPTAGAHVAPGAVYLPAGATPGAEATQTAASGAAAGGPTTPSSATAGAVPASPLTAGASALHGAAARTAAAARSAHAGTHGAAVPGSTPPPPPRVVAARAEAAADAAAKPSQLMDLLGAPGAPVVAVQSGRVVHLGHSRSLGRYLVLRDVYGDIFTYAGLGEVAPRYRRPVPPTDAAQHTPGSATTNTPDGATSAAGAAARDPAPTLPASAGHQAPVTLRVKSHAAHVHAAAPAPVEPEAEAAPAGLGKVRLYAHPGNPLARAVAARAKRSSAVNGRWLPLRNGSLVTQGTVLGHLPSAPGAGAGTLRFAVRPAGDNGTIDPAALLSNWKLLGVALHPRGAKGRVELLGATADEVFAMSRSELQRSVLSDPGVQLDACAQRDVAEGAIDRRALGVLEFLSRSGLQPTVGALQCARGRTTAAGPVFEHFAGGALDITEINGIPIAGHQGPGTITDETIRALLTLPRQFMPHRIISLMEYPHAPNTFARAADWDRIRVGFGPLPGAHATASRRASRTRSSLASSGSLNQWQWDQLITRIAALPAPAVAAKPSSAAIRDPQAAPTNRALGARGPAAGA